MKKKKLFIRLLNKESKLMEIISYIFYIIYNKEYASAADKLRILKNFFYILYKLSFKFNTIT
jgi:hypothetical protein